MIHPSLDHAWQGGIRGRQIGKLVQTQNRALLPQGQQFEKLDPILRGDVFREGTRHISRHLLQLDSSRSLDGLTVESPRPTQPFRQQPRFAHPAAPENHNETAHQGRLVESLDLDPAIGKRENHSIIMPFIHYVSQAY
jgi:hypothetical protein